MPAGSRRPSATPQLAHSLVRLHRMIASRIVARIPSPRCRPPAAPPCALARRAVLGIPLALTDYARTLDWIDAAVAVRQRGYVCVAAVHTVMASREDPELRAAVLGADFTVPDGQPLVWALNAARPPARGPRLRARPDGARLRARRAHRAALLPLRRAQQARSPQLARRAAGCAIPGCGSSAATPPFRALPTPRRPTIAADDQPLRRRRRVGRASASRSRRSGWRGCASGSTRRCWSASAPRSTSTPASSRRRRTALQRLGLEWVFRLAQEPRRLWRRYLRYNPRFVSGFARQYVQHLRARR